MQDCSQTLAVIGAGLVGLAIAKGLEAHGVAYEQLEADDDVGGNWCHGVYETAHIISSKKTTEYSDFPRLTDYPDFPSRQQMLDYLRAYADHFNLRAQIQFNTKLVMARPVAGERWEPEFPFLPPGLVSIGKQRAALRRLCAARLQKPLHHRHRAAALQLRSAGDIGRRSAGAPRQVAS